MDREKRLMEKKKEQEEKKLASERNQQNPRLRQAGREPFKTKEVLEAKGRSRTD